MSEYLNPWYILAETGTSRHVIVMHFGNGDMENFLHNSSPGWYPQLSFFAIAVAELRPVNSMKTPKVAWYACMHVYNKTIAMGIFQNFDLSLSHVVLSVF